MLLYLYEKRDETIVGADEISDKMGIPSSYLNKVAGILKKAELIHSVRGQFGGYHIRNPANSISLYDVIQITEPEKINGCLESEEACSRNNAGGCAVRRFYEIMQEQWEKCLKSMTLEILAANPDKKCLMVALSENGLPNRGAAS